MFLSITNLHEYVSPMSFPLQCIAFQVRGDIVFRLWPLFSDNLTDVVFYDFCKINKKEKKGNELFAEKDIYYILFLGIFKTAIEEFIKYRVVQNYWYATLEDFLGSPVGIFIK